MSTLHGSPQVHNIVAVPCKLHSNQLHRITALIHVYRSAAVEHVSASVSVNSRFIWRIRLNRKGSTARCTLV